MNLFAQLVNADGDTADLFFLVGVILFVIAAVCDAITHQMNRGIAMAAGAAICAGLMWAT